MTRQQVGSVMRFSILDTEPPKTQSWVGIPVRFFAETVIIIISAIQEVPITNRTRFCLLVISSPEATSVTTASLI